MRTTIVASLVLLTTVGVACSTKTEAGRPAATSSADGSAAAETRVALDQLLGEHVFLAAAATGAALGGRTSEFQAAAAALDANSKAVAQALAGPLKKTTEQVYEFWKSHIGFFVDYTTGVATKDKAKQDKAVADLTGYAASFGSLVNSALPSLPADAVRSLVTEHILGLKAVVDAQGAKDLTGAYTKLRDAYQHMDMIGGALAQALAG